MRAYTLWMVILLVGPSTFAQSDFSQNPSEPPVIIIQKEDASLRSHLLMWIITAASRLESEGPESIEDRFKRAGLDTKPSTLSAFQTLGKELDSEYRTSELGRRYQEAQALNPGKPLEEAEWKGIANQFSSERAKFKGRIVGSWLKLLAQEGIDPEQFMHNVFYDPYFSTTSGYMGERPDFEREAELDRIFFEAAEEMLGRSLDQEEIRRERK